MSSLGIKYPTNRDHPLHTGYQWIKGKEIDDGAEGLWRIHDALYDLSSFVSSHPGGKMWLEITKGTDITEAFEVHHISNLPKEILAKYYIRDALAKRNYPFTFHEGDFYLTLKGKIAKELKKIPKEPAVRSEIITDTLLFSYVLLSLLSVNLHSYFLAILAGISLSLTSIASHNFFHRKDNFRMYYFDLTMMQSREWRISHALSHHLYTNTVNDLEISSVEPFLQYLPTQKNFFFRYLSWFYSPIIYAFVFVAHYIKTLIQCILNGKGFRWEMLLPFSVPFLVFLITKESIFVCSFMFTITIMSGSLYFGIVGVNAAHHHPDIFHDGDRTRPIKDMDWGIYQLDAVWDRKDINGSHFLVITNFGDHVLHHLFPTIDHGLLEYLYPVFLETCSQFGLVHKVTTQFELVKGQYRQLAKAKPKVLPPEPTVTYLKS